MCGRAEEEGNQEDRRAAAEEDDDGEDTEAQEEEEIGGALTVRRIRFFSLRARVHFTKALVTALTASR